MRHLMIFIVRLWVDAQAEPPTWEGQVESVGDGERIHVSSLEDLECFIEVQTTRRPLTLEREECITQSLTLRGGYNADSKNEPRISQIY